MTSAAGHIGPRHHFEISRSSGSHALSGQQTGLMVNADLSGLAISLR
jgi:hypothetical protein